MCVTSAKHEVTTSKAGLDDKITINENAHGNVIYFFFKGAGKPFIVPEYNEWTLM